jgi:hypothetical protein
MANGRKNKRAADGRINTLAQTGCYTSDYTHTHTHTQRDFFFSLLGWNRVTSFRLWSRRRPSVFSFANVFRRRKDRSCFSAQASLCVCVCPPRALAWLLWTLHQYSMIQSKNGTNICSFLSARARPLPLAQVFGALNYYRRVPGKGSIPGIYLQATLFITCKCIYRSAPLPPPC